MIFIFFSCLSGEIENRKQTPGGNQKAAVTWFLCSLCFIWDWIKIGNCFYKILLVPSPFNTPSKLESINSLWSSGEFNFFRRLLWVAPAAPNWKLFSKPFELLLEETLESFLCWKKFRDCLQKRIKTCRKYFLKYWIKV